MKLFVGLGNPGSQYASTRHNVGFHCLDKLASKWGWQWERFQRSQIASGSFNGEKVLLAKPLTYMNNSGEAVSELIRWYKLQPSDVCVVYDELDIPTGKIRLRLKGSAAGHNGMKSLIQYLHTDEIPRIRVGIGGSSRNNTINYVLSSPKGDDLSLLESAEFLAVDAILFILSHDFPSAMNTFNPNPKPA